MTELSPEIEEWKDVNDVVYAVSKRARELANEKMDDLRLMVSTDPFGSIHAARVEFAGCDRGELIEMILTEEFCEEFPRSIGIYE